MCVLADTFKLTPTDFSKIRTRKSNNKTQKVTKPKNTKKSFYHLQVEQNNIEIRHFYCRFDNVFFRYKKFMERVF